MRDRFSPSDKLHAIVSGFTAPAYALVDGGHYADLPTLLGRERLLGRSLFLSTADVEVQRAGPWLVTLDRLPDAIDKVLSIVEGKPAAVFWCSDAGEVSLWRHLRGLNMAKIPAWAADGLEAPARIDATDVFETVAFRHWDPRVLGALMPTLDAAQFARVLGSSREVAFLSDDHGGARRIICDRSWPAASPGLLTLSSSQIVALTDRRLSASHRRIMAYLRDVAPQQTVEVSDEDLLYQVRYCESVGRDLGITSERGHAQWAFLMVLSEGRIASDRQVVEFISDSRRSPNVQIEEALKGAIEAARIRDQVE